MVVIKWKKEKVDCYILFKLGIRSITNKTNSILERRHIQMKEWLSLLIYFIQGWQNRIGHPLLETICTVAISAVYLQEDPGISHNQTWVIFRNGTQKLTHDHWLYPRVCSVWQAKRMTAFSQVVTMPVKRCHKSFYTILINIQTFRLVPWNL